MTTDPSAVPGTAATATDALARTQPWVRFFGILGFVTIGFMLVIGLVAGVVGIATGKAETAALMIVYPVLAAVYVYPSVCLLRYARRIRQFVTTSEPHDLASALDAQRAFWKFVGIVSIVSLAIAIVAFFVAIAAGVATAVKAWH